MGSQNCIDLSSRLASLYQMAGQLAGMHATGTGAGWTFGRDWAAQQMATIRAEIIATEQLIRSAKCPFPTITVVGVEPKSGTTDLSGDDDSLLPGDSPWTDPGSGGRFKPKR